MTAVATLHLKNQIAQLLEEKLLPCMAADLWTEHGITLLGVKVYWIDAEFNYQEVLARVSPFLGTHTAAHILAETRSLLQ